MSIFALIPESDNIFDPAGSLVDWMNNVLQAFLPLVVLAAGVLLVSAMFWAWFRRPLRRVVWSATAKEAQRLAIRTVAQQAATKTRAVERRNRSRVQGLDYALLAGTVSAEDLQTLSPEALQRKIDLDNPHGTNSILPLLEVLPLYEGSDDEDHQRRAREINELLGDMREDPLIIERAALAPRVDRMIAEGREAVQIVREATKD